MNLELDRAKVVARLRREGWRDVGGAKHDKFEHAAFSDAVIVPRHRTLSPGVARTIAKGAGWI